MKKKDKKKKFYVEATPEQMKPFLVKSSEEKAKQKQKGKIDLEKLREE